MATTPTQDQVRRALDRVIDPELRRPITDLGMVESVEIADGAVTVDVLLTVAGCPLKDTIAADIRTLKNETDVPVCIGFGIRDGETARQMAALADGVVIGSALVARLHAAFDAKQPLGDTATAFIRDIRAHLDKEPT